MICRSACYDVYFADLFKVFFRKAYAVESYGIIFLEPPVQRFIKPFWLLVNLLEHEMRIAFFFCRLYIPRDLECVPVLFLQQAVVYLDFIFGKNHEFVVLYDVHVACVLKECGYVRSKEILAHSLSDY